jgi:hypothetical protein
MSTSRRLPRGTRLELRLRAVLAVYVLAAALLPLAHHDIVCHLKSSTHCTTCVVGSSGEASADSAVLARFRLNDVGAATAESAVPTHSATLRISSGRAPPAAA